MQYGKMQTHTSYKTYLLVLETVGFQLLVLQAFKSVMLYFARTSV